MTTWHHQYGAAARDSWDLIIDSATPHWEHTGLKVATLAAGERRILPADAVERIIVPLSGSFTVEVVTGERFDLAGRPSVFSGPTDLAYLGPDTAATLSGSGRVAVCEARSTTPRPAARLDASAIPVEDRGAGSCYRAVRNFGVPGVLDAESIIACEVITPSGNWSSYPPHKHDEELDGVEAELEEIYYFELSTIASAPAGVRNAPFGYQRVSASPGRDIDVLVEVHDRDVVLVPFGWHGPSMAAPGYDMYYLNVMAGPGRERAWRITDHPDQAWIRQTW
jgi:5-deoxy-glucuronate isomerase